MQKQQAHKRGPQTRVKTNRSETHTRATLTRNKNSHTTQRADLNKAVPWKHRNKRETAHTRFTRRLSRRPRPNDRNPTHLTHLAHARLHALRPSVVKVGLSTQRTAAAGQWGPRNECHRCFPGTLRVERIDFKKLNKEAEFSIFTIHPTL